MTKPSESVRIAVTEVALRGMFLHYTRKANETEDENDPVHTFALDLLLALWALESGKTATEAKGEFGKFAVAMAAWVEAQEVKPEVNESTWEVIGELSKDRPEGRMRGEVWEIMTSSSWEAFRDDALPWLKDKSELTTKQLEETDWEYVYETFYPEGNEKECEGHESLDGAHMGETVFCDGTCR